MHLEWKRGVLAYDLSPQVRAFVARNINTPAVALHSLSNDPYEIVREGITRRL